MLKSQQLCNSFLTSLNFKEQKKNVNFGDNEFINKTECIKEFDFVCMAAIYYSGIRSEQFFPSLHRCLG